MVFDIEEKIKKEANMVTKDIKEQKTYTRAYVNAVGSEFFSKYLEEHGILNPYKDANICSISRIIENIDISDVILPNINIGVRVIWDEKIIFSPCSS